MSTLQDTRNTLPFVLALGLLLSLSLLPLLPQGNALWWLLPLVTLGFAALAASLAEMLAQRPSRWAWAALGLSWLLMPILMPFDGL
ncbi:hypothetical protein [Ferrimonas marina]|uniref:Uncharacterized protein n=1 Tax=Ferrimonas marina TaxID=299255 RepID=A0A1M5VD94_9GAMM|nr:hypothetical protein [Ferrimonas marina]SHH73084.1 hypothetical protein SAMN02745129_2714 [Ferrimonas marina]